MMTARRHQKRAAAGAGAGFRVVPPARALACAVLVALCCICGCTPDGGEFATQAPVPIITAVIEGRLGTVVALLDAGVDPNTQNRNGMSLLACAALYGQLHVAEMLLKRRGVDPELRDNDFHTPLGHSAMIKGEPHTSAARLLMRYGVDINAWNDISGATPLGMAARNGNLDVGTMLVQQGALVDVPSVHGYTPLATASSVGFVEIVSLLLDCGASVNATTPQGMTPLGLASLAGHTDVVRRLTAAGAIGWLR